MKRLLLFVLIIMGFCGRFASDAKRCPVAQVVVEPVEPLLVRPVQDDMQCRLWVDSVLDRLSLKERVGQLFIYTIAPHQDKSNRELLRKVIEDYKVGGLLFSGGLMQNQVVLTNEAQRMADIPLLITFDGEWGLSMRLRDTPAFPKNMVLGCIQNDSLLYEYGCEMARQCKELGVQVNFAPVADVNINPKNPVINTRSFGEDPVNVANKVIAYARGLEDGGVLSVAKHFPGHGDTDVDSHKALPVLTFTRECVTQVLEEYPDLTGFGLTLGEGMAGMTPQEREAWMTETIIEGMRRANRPSKLVHRVPFSSTTESLGNTSVETERITRASIEREADMGFTEGPIFADFKFNWSHSLSTPKLIKVHGGPLYDTYFNPVSDKYKVTWTARNEDIFCLRWGVPEFVRAHVKLNSPAYVGGYFIGSETYIPAKDYFTTDMSKANWKWAFERQWLYYKIWGRLLYDSDTPDEVFHAEFIRRYGKDGENLLKASSLAGITPLVFASNTDCGWDFTLYSEGLMALVPKDRNRPGTPLEEYVSIDRLIHQNPLDTSFVKVADYVERILAGGSFTKERVTPPQIADSLERNAKQALKLVENINPAKNQNAALIYEVADIKTWANLGLHYAEKIRGAIALQTYRVNGNKTYQQQAIRHLSKGLEYWDKVIEITRPLYNDMPLVHYSEQGGKHWKENDHLRFHWALIRPDVAKDLEIAKR